MIRLFTEEEDIGNLSMVINGWLHEANLEKFNMEYDMEDIFEDFRNLISSDDADLLVVDRDNKIVGMMGLNIFKSPIGKQRIANEHYWYLLPECRGQGVRLLLTAYKWAKEKNCDFFMANASNMASDLHDTVCSMYEKMDMQKFETVYLKKLGG